MISQIEKGLLLLGVSLSLLQVSWADSGAYDLAALGILSVSNYHLSPRISDETLGGRAFGLAAMGAYTFYPGLAIESGLVSITRKFLVNGVIDQTLYTYVFTEVPLFIRYTFRNRVFLRLGPYVAIPSTIESSIRDQSASDVQALPHVDAGLKVGAGVTYPVSEMIYLRGEVIYSFGLANLSTGIANQYSRNLDFLLGAEFHLPSIRYY